MQLLLPAAMQSIRGVWQIPNERENKIQIRVEYTVKLATNLRVTV